jgi:hypothetical protein
MTFLFLKVFFSNNYLMQTKMHGNKKTSSENISSFYLAAVCSVLVFVPHIEALGPSKAVQLRAAVSPPPPPSWSCAARYVGGSLHSLEHPWTL